MTPAARVAAAIEILDEILGGTPAEKVLTSWPRKHRFAGSGDRAAIRDHVFDVLRQKRSVAWLGGGETGRCLMLGWAVANDADLDALFSGQKYAPDVVSDAERENFGSLDAAPAAVRLDAPDWFHEELGRQYPENCDQILTELRTRAPVFLRANVRKASVDEAISKLAVENVEATPAGLGSGAIKVTKNPRRVANTDAYAEGLVELQDAASQAVVDMLPLAGCDTVLDYCAGGGGKSLAIAAVSDAKISAHDAIPARMKDLPDRATRSGVAIELVEGDEWAERRFDLVLCDVPCSGNGAWRRSPQAKWTFGKSELNDLVENQFNILTQASELATKNGTLCYVTCSMLAEENGDLVQKFLDKNGGWALDTQRQFTPLDGGDGFFCAILHRL